jgi:hypothetical protein
MNFSSTLPNEDKREHLRIEVGNAVDHIDAELPTRFQPLALSTQSNVAVALHFPPRRQIHPRPHRIEHEGFGEASIFGEIRSAAGGAGGERGLRGALDVFHLHAEMINPFAPVARR